MTSYLGEPGRLGWRGQRVFQRQGRKASLAKWLRDQTLLMREKTRALPAAEAAFRDEISLEN